MLTGCIKYFTLFIFIGFTLSCSTMDSLAPHSDMPESVLQGKVICIDPGHGGTAETDDYRVGPSGEREEWINLRVAVILQELLEEHGATVLMTRTRDVQVGLEERADPAVENNADVFVSLHHNATADPEVNFPIIYYHGNASENQASVQLGECLARYLAEYLYEGDTPVSLVSDHTIFPGSGTAVLRHSYGIPGVIGEASFFSNPEEEQRLKDPLYNYKEAKAYFRALESFFSQDIKPIKEKYSSGKVEPFEVFQEDERMRKEATEWYDNYRNATSLLNQNTPEAREKAYQLFTLSARSFPDSRVAHKCHAYRSQILRMQGKAQAALMAARRLKEYYVPVEID